MLTAPGMIAAAPTMTDLDRTARLLLDRIRADPDGIDEEDVARFGGEVGLDLTRRALALLVAARKVIRVRVTYPDRPGKWAYQAWQGGLAIGISDGEP